MATHRVEERVFAALGLGQEASLVFERADDVLQGGVLLALPALLMIGLLKRTRETFPWPKGFYPMETIFLTVAFLALIRMGSLEQLRYQSPGEWGKLLGLDRLPEVKTLREKIGLLCHDPQKAAQWSAALARDWLTATDHYQGIYYVDGHVRVYQGHLANRPKRYVAREKLCIRATVDYWVNAMDGRPFFVVTQDLDPGLAATIEKIIVPRLMVDVPNQPSPQALEENRWLHCLTIVFDREAYNLEFFSQMKHQRIAVVTYAKYQSPDWPEEEFLELEVRLINGEKVILSMAERGTRLSNGLWVREIRRRDKRRHQTAIYATDYINPLEKIAAAMFARWCQENFFKYMKDHYGLDRLVEYGVEPLPDTALAPNPKRREIDKQIRKEVSLLHQERAKFTSQGLPKGASAEQAAGFEATKGQLLKDIHESEAQLVKLRKTRKAMPKHVALKDLSPEQRITKLPSSAKHFVDTIKLVAYRAETALVQIVREKMQREDDARSFVCQILKSSANLIPDVKNQTLKIQVHPLAFAAHNQVLAHLCRELNETETTYPGTELKLIFEMLGPA